MPTNKEIQEMLKPLMRAQELERREGRKQVIANHIALDKDRTPEEEKIYKRYKGNIFQRVWQAILNK